MTAPHLLLRTIILLCTLSLPRTGVADVPVPPNVLNPQSIPEAWNVIRLATANVDRLIQERRLEEVIEQISMLAPSLRTLGRLTNGPDIAVIPKEATRALGWINAIALTSNQKSQTATEDGFKSLKAILDELARHYDPKVVHAEIYACPVHPDFLSREPGATCDKCGLRLFPRRIPYSFIYTVPGEPTTVLTATASGPIEAGKKVEVKVRLVHRDQSPVLVSDLAVTHTKPIHLLVEDPSLSDYHHENPVETGTPGEYVFSFTPARTAPYRIWANIIPYATGMQELPYTDLPSPTPPAALGDTENRFTTDADGFHFELALNQGNHIPLSAGKTRAIFITVTDSTGQPVKTLEPVMNAFAHLVAFYGDYETVVHLHPAGGDILNPAARGGPGMTFQFFPPKPGFVRLYCQVQIGGKTILAPFNLNAAP